MLGLKLIHVSKRWYWWSDIFPSWLMKLADTRPYPSHSRHPVDAATHLNDETLDCLYFRRCAGLLCDVVWIAIHTILPHNPLDTILRCFFIQQIIPGKSFTRFVTFCALVWWCKYTIALACTMQHWIWVHSLQNPSDYNNVIMSVLNHQPHNR